ncbi:MAG: acyl-CoA dehydrogenase [Peptococcaceae bacterium]|nr:MAG: acyl-CoA dehydrogenase [Peptococcaceae bacterium]
MNFYFSDEHELLRRTVRKIAEEKVRPRAAAIDEQAEYPWDIFEIFKEAGLFGTCIPEEYGGSGLGTTGLCLAIEEVAKYCCSSGLMLLLTYLPTQPIRIAGSEGQKKKYLGAVARGKMRCAFCLTEPGAGSDAANIRTSAIRKSDYYIINGTKCFISGASVADFVTVFAKTRPDAGSQGVTAFIVEKGTPGFSIGTIEKKMGVRGMPLCEVVFDEVRVPLENMVGEENKGFQLAMRTLNSIRPAVGARGLGLAQGALEYAMNYAKERHAFGGPLTNLQGLRWMMADMATQIEAARLLIMQAAFLIDDGKFSKEYAGILSMSKVFPTDMAVKVAIDAAQILGGHGYIQDHPMERYIRDAKQLQIVEGTSQVQREIISRNILQYGLPRKNW